MYPYAVRSPDLCINKSVRRFPFGNFSFPVEGDAVQLYPVIYQCPFSHFYGQWSNDAEFQLRRRDKLKIARIGEEFKYFFDGPVGNSFPGYYSQFRLFNLCVKKCRQKFPVNLSTRLLL